MRIIVDSNIKVSGSQAEYREIIKYFTYPNPKYDEALRFNRSTRNINPSISLVYQLSTNAS